MKKRKLKYRWGFRYDKYVWDIIPFIQIDTVGVPAAIMVGWLCFGLVIPFGKTHGNGNR